MKKLLVIAGLLIGFISKAQLPSIPGFTNINQKYQWYGVLPPNDTSYSKWGLAIKSGTLYVGNGTLWTAVGSGGTISIPGNYGNILVNRDGFLSTPGGDSLKYDNTGLTIKQLEGTGARIVTVSPLGLLQASQVPLQNGVVGNGCQVVRSGTDLEVTVTTPCTYNINNLQYSLSAPVVITLTTADGSNPRRDNIYVNTSSTAGAEAGTPNANPEVPTIDPTTQLSLTDVLIPTGATEPSIGQEIVRDEGAGGEATITKVNFTSTDNYSTNPYHGTISQRVTAMSNNGYMYWEKASGNWSKSAYSTLLLYVRNNSALNANRTLTVRLFNSATQVGAALSIHNYGYSRTITGSYQIIAIPMSAFTGADAFNRIRLTNTGTGGTVDVQIDYIQLQSGVSQPTNNNALTSLFRRTGTDSVYGVTAGGATVFQYIDSTGGGASSFGESDTLLSSSRYVNLNNEIFDFKNGQTRFGKIDSVPVRVDYSWATNPVSQWTVSGTSPTTGSSKTTINGTTTLTWPNFSGAENWSFEETFVTNAKSNAVQTTSFLLRATYQSSVLSRRVSFVLADTAGYINYYISDASSTVNFTSRNQYSFVWASGDTIDVKGRFRQGRMVYTMTNRSNGSRSELSIKQAGASFGSYNVANVANIELSQVGNFTYVGNFKYYVDEPFNPDVAFLGNSVERKTNLATNEKIIGSDRYH